MANLFRAVLFFILAVTFSTATAEEGLVIESKITTGAMGMGGEKTQMIDFIAGDRTRNDRVSEPFGILRFDPETSAENTITIEHYNTQTGWDIDLLTKTYVETDLSPTPDVSDVPIDTGFVSFNFPQDTLKGKFIWITTLDSSNVMDTINGYPCYRVSLFSNCEPSITDSMLMITDIWMCDSFPAMDIYRNFQTNQRRSFGIRDYVDLAETDLDEVEGFNEILKLHLKELLRRTMLFGRIVMKFDLNLKTAVGRPRNLNDSTAADSTGFLEDVSDAFSAFAFAMYQKLFGSGQDKLYMNVISMSYEVTDIQLRDLPDSLFVLPEGLTLKEETAAE